MSPSSKPDALAFDEITVEKGDSKFRFRELSATEMDDIQKKSETGKNDPNGNPVLDGRLNLRLQIAASSVEPKITLDDIGAWPTTFYVKVGRAVNRLNSFDPDATSEAEWLKSLGYKVEKPETAPNL